MAPWPIVKDGSPLGCVEIVRKCKNSNGLCFDHDLPVNLVVDDCKYRLRTLFDQVLSCFSREVSVNKYLCNIPALLGDGRSADLFKLFWVVRKRGGYDVVSRNGLWGYVAKECGLNVRVMASIKLIHFKYLSHLDRLFSQFSVDDSLRNSEGGIFEKLELLSLELNEFKGTLLNCKRRKKNLSSSRPYCSNLDICMRELNLLEGESSGEVYNGSKRNVCDDDENFYVQDDNGVALLAKSVVEKVINPKKKKRGSLSFSEMIKWVIHVEKHHHDDVATGRIPECSKWKEYGSNELWIQVLSAREELITRKHVDSVSEESHLQKKPRTHPSMYEDNDVQNNNTSVDRLIKRICMTKSQLCPCCNSTCSSPCKSQSNITPKKLSQTKNKSSEDTSPVRRQVCVGPHSQAEIPEWVGTVSETDLKWLGTQMWPPQNGLFKPAMETDPVGKGRQNSCKCFLPGSTECVRFHTAEKRMRLKIELGGPLFYRWGFNRMGEEVSLSWDIEEERRFKKMTINHTSLNKFWPNAYKLFPSRTREKLVSYYFNVLVMQRRSYQNRVTPDNIDSDDDETEFGSVGGSFGYERVKNRGSRLLVCSSNTQCFDLE